MVRSDLERNVADTEARLKNDIRQKQSHGRFVTVRWRCRPIGSRRKESWLGYVGVFVVIFCCPFLGKAIGDLR